jgi:hypothetical protein
MVTTRASARLRASNDTQEEPSTSKAVAAEPEHPKMRLPSLHAQIGQVKRKNVAPQKSCEGKSKAESDLLRELGVVPQPLESTAQATARYVWQPQNGRECELHLF